MTQLSPKTALILAGGQARRMGGRDKAEIVYQDKRLIDHVLDRLCPQVDHILISGKQDYGTGYIVLPDHPDGPQGPAAGLYAGWNWMQDNAPRSVGFLTVPVDGPFLPTDLYTRLAGRTSAVVRDHERLHPTFGYWQVQDLAQVFGSLKPNPSLTSICQELNAREVEFDSSESFRNMNAPDDLQN